MLLSLIAFILTAAPGVTGSMDNDQIRKVVQANRGQVRVCIEEALARTPDFAAKLPVKFVISPEGKVASAEISADVGDQPLRDCMIAAVKTWVFPKPKGGGAVVVTYPFMFHPGD